MSLETHMRNDSNTAEQLARRLEMNRSGRDRLSELIWELASPLPGDRVLDIGCGLGAHLLPISEAVQHITGIDLSPELLENLGSRLAGHDNVSLHAGDMDQLLPNLPDGSYSLIYSIYALYYSRDLPALVGQVHRLLRPGGRFLVVAPDVGNNQGWFQDLSRLFALPAEIQDSPRISREKILPPLLEHFREVRCRKFVNQVRFASLDKLMDYYDSCRAYCPPEGREQARRFFAQNWPEQGYVIEKRALAILALKE